MCDMDPPAISQREYVFSGSCKLEPRISKNEMLASHTVPLSNGSLNICFSFVLKKIGMHQNKNLACADVQCPFTSHFVKYNCGLGQVTVPDNSVDFY